MLKHIDKECLQVFVYINQHHFFISVIFCSQATRSIIQRFIFSFNFGSSKCSILYKYFCLSSISATIWSNIQSSYCLSSFLGCFQSFFYIMNEIQLNVNKFVLFCQFLISHFALLFTNQIWCLHPNLEVLPLLVEFLFAFQICPEAYALNLHGLLPYSQGYLWLFFHNIIIFQAELQIMLCVLELDQQDGSLAFQVEAAQDTKFESFEGIFLFQLIVISMHQFIFVILVQVQDSLALVFQQCYISQRALSQLQFLDRIFSKELAVFLIFRDRLLQVPSITDFVLYSVR